MIPEGNPISLEQPQYHLERHTPENREGGGRPAVVLSEAGPVLMEALRVGYIIWTDHLTPPCEDALLMCLTDAPTSPVL